MKKILILLLIIIGFTSCQKKEVLHKVGFEVTFLDKPRYGSSNFFDVYPYPYDPNNRPQIDREVTKVWKYEYYQLKDGDKVEFVAAGQLDYYYEMRVYIDDVEVSYLRAVVSHYNYYATLVEERRGLSDETSKTAPSIKFIYHEN